MSRNDESTPRPSARHEHGSDAWKSAVTVIHEAAPPAFPEGAHVCTARVEFPPGDPGTPPHRHSGPVFGYVLEGEMLFELEGEPARVIRAGEAFWEPGGDVIHYSDANHRTDTPLRFLATMVCQPGKPMLELVEEQELEERKPRRAPRTT
ncbi:cupin domain-containing protein [Streptomyces sp. NPDC046985]|uniref:cupin domain-containing protein n=1 Tax=Streptomyces sp. NPDC046985 TaxID=3155377 RepID=UPI0033D9512A